MAFHNEKIIKDVLNMFSRDRSYC